MYNIKDMVKDGRKVTFVCYRQGDLWYKTENDFQFPVPVSDAGDATFFANDKAILFMRYIRAHIKWLEDARTETLEQLKAQDGL